MSRRHQLINSAIQVLIHNRDGSFRTQNDRRSALLMSLKELYDSGYQLNHVKYIQKRHIYALVNGWLTQGISTGAMKNRVSHFRWMMQKLNIKDVIPSNDALGIPKRVYISNEDKSRHFADIDFHKIDDTLMQLSLKGQQLFGLRVEESLKLQPYIADQGNSLYIKGSWAKGGRDRLILIRNEEQKKWIEDCKKAVSSNKDSLIPTDTSYKTYRKRFEKRCERAGISKLHGQRHYYAHQRYVEFTGFTCPVKGGPSWQDMSAEQRKLDRSARLQISAELGHSRPNIVNSYCGR